MNWRGKVFGGVFGFMLGGPLGAILGASLGHQFDSGTINLESYEPLRPGDQHRIQMAFFTATFSVMGHIAKADGRVSPEEITLANRVMDQMSLNSEMRKSAVSLFNQGKSPNFPLDDALIQFYQECHRRRDLIRMFLEILIREALADGTIEMEEERLLLHICGRLKVSQFEFQRLKMMAMAEQRFQQSGYGYQQDYGRQQGQRQARPSRSSVQDAYDVLGVSATASDDEVKKAYRRLMSQNHPDKLVAKGLPEEMMKLAKEKTQKITKAYEIIQETRKK
jgi:DnaJ like chaperone protein